MSGQFNVAEELHTVSIIAPVDINGGAVESDYFNVKNAASCQIVLTLGVTGAATTFTVYESDDSSGSNETAIAFAYYAETTAGGDTLGARTAATTSGIAASTNDGLIYVIDVDPRDLTDGYPYLVLKLSDPSAATLVSAVALLGNIRHAGIV